jgi:hypothetical protein
MRGSIDWLLYHWYDPFWMLVRTKSNHHKSVIMVFQIPYSTMATDRNQSYGSYHVLIARMVCTTQMSTSSLRGCGSIPIMVCGGPFRTHWQRHHLIENHVDAWNYQCTGNGILPKDDFVGWQESYPSIADAALYFAVQIPRT